jgi:hypothetical protein
VRVKADNEGRDAERSDTTRLGVPLQNQLRLCGSDIEAPATDLLNTGNVLGDVLDADGVLHSETVGLTFDTRLVDEDTAIGG